MLYQFACPCGETLSVDGAAAGSSVVCACGQEVPVPALSALRTAARPAPPPTPVPPAPPAGPADEALPPAVPEVIEPTLIQFRSDRGGGLSQVTAALAPDAVWIQHAWRVERIPLAGLAAEVERFERTVRLTPAPGAAVEGGQLWFRSRAEATRWRQAILDQPDSPEVSADAPEGVALVRGWPDVPHAVAGWVECVGPTRLAAERGLQLRAALRGGDAVVRVQREKLTGTGLHRGWGLAVRSADAGARGRLRRIGYRERVNGLANRMLALVLALIALILALVVLAPGSTALVPATGQRPSEALAEAAPWLAAGFGWPVLLTLWLRVTGRPQLLTAAGLAVLAVTAGRGLAAMAGRVAGAHGGLSLLILFDPVDWAVILGGLVLFLRARRLATAAPGLLTAPAATRPGWARGLVAVTIVYALGLAALVGWANFEVGALLARPGVDPRREHQALRALNDGVDALNRGDLAAADRSLTEARRIWEELAAGPDVPPEYPGDLAATLYNLGLLRHRQGRLDEAEACYARAVEVGTRVKDRSVEDSLREILREARRALDELREFREGRGLDEKDKKAWAAYDAGVVAARKGDPAAAGMLEEAIGLWEEILPRVNSPEYRKAVTPQLALAYLRLAHLRDREGKPTAAEAALIKAVARAEAALALGPDRPILVRDYLDQARQMLTALRERTHEEEIDRLTADSRWAAAEDAHRRGITDQEARAKAGPDKEAATRSLAYRLDQFAWFLAHCPADHIRDPKAAAGHARRATELQPAVPGYWFTLAVTHHRAAAWRDSQAALSEFKTRAGELDGSGWFLTAMNLHHLRQPAEARDALRKGVEWIDDRRRQGETDPAVRIQFELIRPSVDAWRREAERLLDGKDPSGDRIGEAGRRKSETGRPLRTDRLAGSFPDTLTAAARPGSRSANRRRPTGRRRRSTRAGRSRRSR